MPIIKRNTNKNLKNYRLISQIKSKLCRIIATRENWIKISNRKVVYR